jgi:hypothetical protein
VSAVTVAFLAAGACERRTNKGGAVVMALAPPPLALRSAMATVTGATAGDITLRGSTSTVTEFFGACRARWSRRALGRSHTF